MAFSPMLSIPIYLTLLVLIYAEERCLGPPPEVRHARPVVRNTTHGGVVEYHCRRHFKITSYGSITCIDGVWKGEPPICKDTGCHIRSLQNGGLDERGKTFYLHREKLTPSCIAGYDLVTKSNITCYLGQWRILSPLSRTFESQLPCVPARCTGEPPEIENGKILNFTKSHLSDVSYKCNRGYELIRGPETVTCKFGTWIGTAPICKETFDILDVSCKDIKAPRNGNAAARSDRQVVGSFVEYGCNPGYDMIGAERAICLESGEWSFPPPVCIAQCTVPNVENGLIMMRGRYPLYEPYDRRKPDLRQLVVPLTVKNGTELYVRCNNTSLQSPRAQVNDFKISCINGVWSPEPTCLLKIKCDIPEDIPNGKAYYDSLEEGSVLHYECNEGFQLDVIQTRTCSNDGKWTGEKPSCRAKMMECEIPKDLPNGKVYYDSLEQGSELYYECNKGFQLDVIQKRTCSDDGKWTGEEPSCREPCTIPKIENGIIGEYKKMYKYEGGIRTEMIFSESVVHSKSKNDTKLLFKCTDSRFEPTGAQAKELNISCINGIWSHELICTAASCRKPPPQVENAIILTKDIINGTILTYMCAKHFRKMSSGAVTCQYGEWTGQAPICIDTRCLTKDMRPDDGLVNLEVSERVTNGNYADISCGEKYHLEYEKPKCLDGSWSYQNDFSPCQIRNHCIVPNIHGTFLRPKDGLGGYRFWRRGYDLEYSEVDTGEHVETGDELSVRCSESYFFPGADSAGYFKVSCVRGEWQPPPICTREEPVAALLPAPILADVKSSASSISFTWEFPSTLADSIDGYVLSCVEKGKEKTETLINKLQRNYTIKHLESSTEYQIALQAYKSDVRSVPAFSLVKTALEKKVLPAAAECSIPSLAENLPEDVVINDDDIISETVPEGTVFRLACGTIGMQPTGDHSATCDYNGRWKIGKDIKCIIACGPIKKPTGSNLIIDPEKDMYRFGETVIFLCPLGHSLNTTTVRIMCLRGRWSLESVPHCKNE